MLLETVSITHLALKSYFLIWNCLGYKLPFQANKQILTHPTAHIHVSAYTYVAFEKGSMQLIVTQILFFSNVGGQQKREAVGK